MVGNQQLVRILIVMRVLPLHYGGPRRRRSHHHTLWQRDSHVYHLLNASLSLHVFQNNSQMSCQTHSSSCCRINEFGDPDCQPVLASVSHEEGEAPKKSLPPELSCFLGHESDISRWTQKCMPAFLLSGGYRFLKVSLRSLQASSGEIGETQELLDSCLS